MWRKKSQTGASELQGDVSSISVSELQESVTGVSEAQGNVSLAGVSELQGSVSVTGVSKAPADAEPEPAVETLHGEVVGLEDNSTLKVQATSADSDKVSDAIDEGRKLEEGNKKLERRLRLQKLCMLALFALILILLLKSCQSQPEEGKGKPNLETGEYVDTQPDAPHIDGYTAIPVIDDFEVSKSQPYASLYNPEANAGYSYLQYRFTDLSTGDVFYESGLVEPGKVFSVAFGELLPAGEHEVLVEILNFDYEDFTVQKNGGKSEIVVTVKE